MHFTVLLLDVLLTELHHSFKVTGALGFCSWQHPSMGTNLRESVPADPLKIPRFMPIDEATPAERAVESAALIREAGTSARRLGVPLTMHDFPREPVKDVREDAMHSSVPLFGLGAPRWRQVEGLPPHDIPGTASYDGVWAKPRGNKGVQGWDGCARKLRTPLCRLGEEGVDPYGIGAPSSSSIRDAGARILDALDVPTRRASLDNPPSTPPITTGSHSPHAEAARPPSSAPARTGLSRTSTMATIGSSTTSRPRPPPLRRCHAMAHIGGPTPENADCTVATLRSAFSDTRSAVHGAATAAATTNNNDMINTPAGGDFDIHIRSTSASTTSLSRTFSTTATIGSPPPSGVSRTAKTATTAKITKAKSKSASKVKAKAKTEATGPVGQKKQGTKRRSATTAAITTTSTSASDSALTSPSPLPSTFTSIPDSSTSSAPELEQPKSRPTKRGRRTAELDSASAEDQQQGKETEEQPGEGEEPPRKRRKRAAAPSPSPTICRGVGVDVTVKVEEAGGGDDQERPTSRGRIGVRRSTRVTRASAAVAATQPVPAPAQRGQAIKGKKAKKAKARS